MAEVAYDWIKPIVGEGQYRRLMEIRGKVAKVLENNLLPHYTKHDIEHSDRICQNVYKILREEKRPEIPLSQTETIIMVLASFYHDISLQLPKAHHIDKKVNELTPNDLEEMRKNHGGVSSRIILQSVSNRTDTYELGIIGFGFEELMTFVAEVCEKHQSFKIYSPTDIQSFATDSDPVTKIRLGLLIGLLRISDELDCDRRRVDIDKLNEFEIPIDSKTYWFTSHYIDAVEISNGKITLSISYPENTSSPIVNYLVKKISAKLTTEILIVQDVLYASCIHLRESPVIETKSSTFGMAKRSLPDDIIRFISSKLDLKGPDFVRTEIKDISERRKQKDIDWMSYWGMVGNPFSDYPLDYGDMNVVLTKQFKQITSELQSYLNGPKGEIRMIIAERGQGKTTLFQYLKGFFEPGINTYTIDIGDKAASIVHDYDITKVIFPEIYFQLSKVNESSSYSPDNLLDRAKKAKKSIIFVDSLDRLSEDKDDIVRQFFVAGQHMLSSLKHNFIIVFSCSPRWSRFIDNKELSYLGVKNQWNLVSFSTSESEELVTNRLKSAGIKFEDVFDKDCISALHSMSNGNPRALLQMCESICRFGAEKKIEKINIDFLREKYKEEFETNFKTLIRELVDESPDYANALNHIRTFSLEMEKRNLNSGTGYGYLLSILDGNVPQESVKMQYYTPLRYVSILTNKIEKDGKVGGQYYAPTKTIKALFSRLTKKGYVPRDFVSYFSTNPFIPVGEQDEVISDVRSGLLFGDDVKFFEDARIAYDEALAAEGKSAGLIIGKAWDAIEYLLVAILIKRGALKKEIYENEVNKQYYVNYNGIQRYARGAGKIMADRGIEVKFQFLDCVLKKDKIFLRTWNDLNWILLTRNNIVRGKTEYASQYGQKDIEVSRNHLRNVFKELIPIYNH